MNRREFIKNIAVVTVAVNTIPITVLAAPTRNELTRNVIISNAAPKHVDKFVKFLVLHKSKKYDDSCKNMKMLKILSEHEKKTNYPVFKITFNKLITQDPTFIYQTTNIIINARKTKIIQ